MGNISRQWEKLTQEEFVQIDDRFLDTFRAPGARNKFVAWDPFERSTRYFKFLLFTTAAKQSARFFEAYARIANRQLGDPLSVRCGGCDIDADYLAAIEEWEFLTDAGALDNVRTVVEIGAGFGRTCHMPLALRPVEHYVIVDLEPMLKLSRAYLQRVSPGANVSFIANDDHDRIGRLTPDLVISIDSFQEMPPDVVTFYMTHVVQRAPRFYCKNPVGKYRPDVVGLSDPGADKLMDVFKLGYCQDVIDIFNDDALKAARTKYLEAYWPPPASTGAPYALAASKPMDLFPYFHHALSTRQDAHVVDPR